MGDFMPWDDRTKRRLKLRDLDVLLAVVETGSMGKAAKRLNISQPAVSKAVVELEDALGVRLVDRSRRGVVPTLYGLALAKHSVAIFNDLRQGVQDINFLSRDRQAIAQIPADVLSPRRRRYVVAVQRRQ